MILWANRIPLLYPENRVIPESLQQYLVSPVKPITETEVELDKKLVLTSGIFTDRWSYVYFSYKSCLPFCKKSYEALPQLQSALQASDIQFVLIDLDAGNRSHNKDELSLLAEEMALDKPLIVKADELAAEQLADEFTILFLQTVFANGDYQIEQ